MAAGALVRSVPGRWARTRLESAVFQRIPGCRFVADVIPGAAEAGHRPQPAPARIEEWLPCPDHRSLQGWPPRRLRARHAVADERRALRLRRRPGIGTGRAVAALAQGE